MFGKKIWLQGSLLGTTLSAGIIKAMRSTTFTAVVECAGNGRVYYVPPKEGLQSQTGAVGNAAWTGVILREILEMAGVRGTAREVLLVGADSGVVDTNKKTASPGPRRAITASDGILGANPPSVVVLRKQFFVTRWARRTAKSVDAN